MTYLVVDEISAQPLAEWIAVSVRDPREAFRLIEYSQLAQRESFPPGRYVFLNLVASWPSRLELAARYEEAIRSEGGSIWNAPSGLLPAGSRIGLARRLTPDLAIEPALGHASPAFPCRLRAAHAAFLLESDWLSNEPDYEATLADWVLRCTEPDLLFRVSPLSGPPEKPLALEVAVRCGSEVFWGSASPKGAMPLAEAASQIRHRLNAIRRDFAAVEYWIEKGEIRLWNVHDRPEALLGKDGRLGPRVFSQLQSLETSPFS